MIRFIISSHLSLRRSRKDGRYFAIVNTKILIVLGTT